MLDSNLLAISERHSMSNDCCSYWHGTAPRSQLYMKMAKLSGTSGGRRPRHSSSEEESFYQSATFISGGTMSHSKGYATNSTMNFRTSSTGSFVVAVQAC